MNIKYILYAALFFPVFLMGEELSEKFEALEDAYQIFLKELDVVDETLQESFDSKLLDLGNEITFRVIAYKNPNKDSDLNDNPFVRSYYNIYIAELYNLKMKLKHSSDTESHMLRIDELMSQIFFSYPVSADHSAYEGVMFTKILAEYNAFIQKHLYEKIQEKLAKLSEKEKYPLQIFLANSNNKSAKEYLNETNSAYLDKLKIVFDTYQENSIDRSLNAEPSSK